MRWPTDKQAIRKQYQSDGFVVLSSFFDTDQVTEIRSHLQRYISDVVPQVSPMDVFYQSVGDSSTIKMLPRMNRHDNYFESMLHHGRLPEIAEYFWSCPAVAHDAAYFNKPPKIGEPTPPHQDGFYFNLDPCEALTMWLALDEVDEENGCVRYIAGSNRGKLRPHNRTQVLGFSQGIEDFGESDVKNEVAVCVSPGDVIVHDAMTIHRAEANTSETRFRRALGFVFYSNRAKVDHAASERYQRRLESEWKAAGKIKST